MKILFVGLGSIGQRHLQNLKSLPIAQNATITALRKTKSNRIIIDGKVTSDKSLAERYDLTELFNDNDAISFKPDVVFICNPSSLHIESAIRFSELGSHMFIEKPLATEIKDVQILKKNIREKNIIAMVGYQTRFHAHVKKIKTILEERSYGKVIFANFNWFTYLPDYHPYEDFHEGYAGRSDLGGGVTFSLIHEFDLIQYFFGLPSTVYALEGDSQKLNLEVDETVTGSFLIKNNTSNHPVSFALSFAQGVEKRGFSILMDEALIECDLTKNSLTITDHQAEIIYSDEISNFERNDLFMAEIEHFFDSVSNNQETEISVEEGEKSLKMALAVKKSLRTSDIEKI